jgi:hypothetical protein
MSGLEISDAVALFSTLFNLAIWAAGLICVAYVLAVVQVLAQKFKLVTDGIGKYARKR